MSLSDAASPRPSGLNGLNGLNGLKRKRDLPAFSAAAAAANAQRLEGTGSSFLNQMQEAVKYLKSKRDTERSFDDIASFMSIQFSDGKLLRRLELLLQKASDKISYDPHGLGGVGSYKYNPIIPVENADQLKAYLQKQTSSLGLKFDDIKDGWPDSAPILDDMCINGELLLNKDKKGTIKNVWQDDPTLHHSVSLELQMSFGKVKLPANADEVREKLEAVGLKPTSAPRQVVKAQEKTKKKAIRKGGKTTNTHITHLLKDYSHKRK